jgi:hypothetical protein
MTTTAFDPTVTVGMEAVDLPIFNRTAESSALMTTVDAGPCDRMRFRLTARSALVWISVNGHTVWCADDQLNRCRGDRDTVTLAPSTLSDFLIDPGNLPLRRDRQQQVRVLFYGLGGANTLDVQISVETGSCPVCPPPTVVPVYAAPYVAGCSNFVQLISPAANWSIGNTGTTNTATNVSELLAMRQGALEARGESNLIVARVFLPPLLATCESVRVAAFHTAASFSASVAGVSVYCSFKSCGPNGFPTTSIFMGRNILMALDANRKDHNFAVNLTSVRAAANSTDDRLPLVIFYVANNGSVPQIAVTIPQSQIGSCMQLVTTTTTSATVIGATTATRSAQVSTTTTTSTSSTTFGAMSATTNAHVSSTPTDKNNNTPLIAGAAVGSFMFLAVVTLLVFFFCRRNSKAGSVAMMPARSGDYGMVSARNDYGQLSGPESPYAATAAAFKAGIPQGSSYTNIPKESRYAVTAADFKAGVSQASKYSEMPEP